MEKLNYIKTKEDYVCEYYPCSQESHTLKQFAEICNNERHLDCMRFLSNQEEKFRREYETRK